MLIKDDETNEERFLYSNIEGFKYEEGFKYKLEIEISKLKKPIIDGSSMKYKLIKVIYKNKVDTSSTLNNQKKEIKAQNIEPIQKQDSKGKININTASIKELSTIKGIGKKTAEKIIEYRKNNKFKNIEEVTKVKGIGKGKFNKIKEFISVN
jgi:comEA protein